MESEQKNQEKVEAEKQELVKYTEVSFFIDEIFGKIFTLVGKEFPFGIPTQLALC